MTAQSDPPQFQQPAARMARCSMRTSSPRRSTSGPKSASVIWWGWASGTDEWRAPEGLAELVAEDLGLVTKIVQASHPLDDLAVERGLRHHGLRGAPLRAQ